MEEKHEIRMIFLLKRAIEHTMFRKFLRSYDLPKGLNKTHIMTLMNLNFLKSASMSFLAHRLNMEKGSFTTVANKLIKLGYVVSTRSEKDKRIYELSLTDKGRELAEDFGSKHRNYMSELVDQLGKEKKKEFFQAMDLVTSTIVSMSDDDEMTNILKEITQCQKDMDDKIG